MNDYRQQPASVASGANACFVILTALQALMILGALLHAVRPDVGKPRQPDKTSRQPPK